MDLEAIWVAKRQLEAPHEVEPPPPDIEDFMHRRFVASHPTCLLRQAEQLLGEEDHVDELRALGLPMLVAYGPDDDAWPPSVQAEMATRLGAAARRHRRRRTLPRSPAAGRDRSRP